MRRERETGPGRMRVAIAGFGTIGRVVGRALDRGIEGLELVAVAARDADKARRAMSGYAKPVPVLPLARLADEADIIAECAPAAAFAETAVPALRAGRILVTVSGAGLLAHPEVVDLARRHGGRIILATGALVGLDMVRAAAEGTIAEVRIVTRKHPRTLAGAPHIEKNRIDLDAIRTATRVFEGSAREGAAAFPANVNVAAALGLAGVGPDATRLEVWADPAMTTNRHTVIVKSDSAQVEMTIDNVPSEENPRTGKITALSMIAALRGLTAPLRVGT
jgi:aspartate dehydrogenase